MSRSPSPPRPSSKRIKLENDAEDEISASDIGEELDGDHCSICLQLLLDRTVIPECSHEFCFECIVTWSDQSRRCPLCTRTIGPYLIHHIRSNFDYQKYHLPPLRSSPPPIRPLRPARRYSIQRRPAQERRWGIRERREQDVADELERAIDRRRWVYHNHLYAKHVASNTFTRYRPFPTPAQFLASQDYISRATMFIRRELRVWVNLDVEFLTTFTLSLLKAIDIRSESTIKLLAEFLDMDLPYCEGSRFPNAEHFAHELYSFLRSPYKSLSAYDMNVQYDTPAIVNIRANRDSKIAPDSHVIKEVVTPHSSWTRHHSSGWSPPRNGNGHFGSKLNGQDTNHNVERDPFGSPPSRYAEKYTIGDGADSSNPLSDARLNGSAEAHAPRATDERSQTSPRTSSNGLTAFHSEVNGKGKQRASAVEGPETRVTDDHSHVHTNFESPRSDEEVEGPQRNTSIDTSKRLDLGRSDDLGIEQSNGKSTQSQLHLRSRNPLLIAQAHLLHCRARPKAKQPHLLPTEHEGDPSDLRQSSQSVKRPSLLSRITDPERQTSKTEMNPPQPDPVVSSQSDTSAQLVTEDLRIKLARRLDVERAAQANRGQKVAGSEGASYSVTPRAASTVPPSRSFPNDCDASSLREGRKFIELEAKARARVRLRMKLAVEKHLRAPDARTNIENDCAPEEKPRATESREGMLRAVLENRRRGG